MADKMAIIAITVRTSISVKPFERRFFRLRLFIGKWIKG